MKQPASRRRSHRWLPAVLVTIAALALGVLWIQPPWFVRAFDLRGDRGVITGIVLDEHGAPIADAGVQCFPSGLVGISSGFDAKTDAQGAFLVRGMDSGEPGDLLIGAAGFVLATQDGVHGGDRQVRVVLARAAVLKIRFRVQPPSVARDLCLSIHCMDWSGSGVSPNASRQLDEDGSFEVDECAAGVYELKLSRCRSTSPGVTLAERAVLRAGETTDMGTLDLEAIAPELLHE